MLYYLPAFKTHVVVFLWHFPKTGFGKWICSTFHSNGVGHGGTMHGMGGQTSRIMANGGECRMSKIMMMTFPQGYGSALKVEEEDRHMNVNVSSSGQGTKTVILQIPKVCRTCQTWPYLQQATTWLVTGHQIEEQMIRWQDHYKRPENWTRKQNIYSIYANVVMLGEGVKKELNHVFCNVYVTI